MFHFDVYRTLYKGCPALKSKLLERISYGVTQSNEAVEGQQENDWSRPTKGYETPRNRVNRAVAQAGKNFTGLLSETTDRRELSVLQQALQTIHTATNMYGPVPQHVDSRRVGAGVGLADKGTRHMAVDPRGLTLWRHRSAAFLSREDEH
jgi:hypothetical protein